MPKPRVLSGRDIVRIFESFGFSIADQKGSHIKLRRIAGAVCARRLPYPTIKSSIEGRLFRSTGKELGTFRSQNFESIFMPTNITKRIIEAHGGTIAAESDGAGKGSTFIVELPA